MDMEALLNRDRVFFLTKEEQFREELGNHSLQLTTVSDLATTAFLIAKHTPNSRERELCRTLVEALMIIEKFGHTSNETLEAVIDPLEAILSLPMYQAETPPSTATPTPQQEADNQDDLLEWRGKFFETEKGFIMDTEAAKLARSREYFLTKEEMFREGLQTNSLQKETVSDLATTAYIIANRTDNPQEAQLCHTLEQALTQAEQAGSISHDLLDEIATPLQIILSLPMYQQSVTPTGAAS